MIKRRYRVIDAVKIMGDAPKRVLGTQVNVLLWNVFKCQKNGWQEDFLRLIKNKDLILLQEAILNSPFDFHFNGSLKHQWIMARSFRHVKTNIETGVKTGCAVAAIKHEYSASAHGEPITNTKKMLLATLYPMDVRGQSLLVVNSHLINFVSFEKFQNHLQQVFQTLQHHVGPVLLAGDFNTWNIKRLDYFKSLAMANSLTEVKMTRQPRLKHLFRHLDHIYCRGIEIVDVHVHSEVRSSDHFPISLSIHVLNDVYQS